VEVVTVDVSVTRADAPVLGLAADDFVVTDNGIQQRIDTVTVAPVPLSVTLVLDTSLSVAGARLDSLIRASELAVNNLRTNDYVSLITFASTVVRPVALTTNVESVRSALHAITGAGNTTFRRRPGGSRATQRPSGRLANLVQTQTSCPPPMST
jgi:hypothetical protein